eukprot:CAMPEP_0178975360 /NCGR_PEP_ID=MMETSP0789-20121207/23090_1 /TAXON_ID=3005 /ORGANISM="Rhizosolenia setigera, Strain CCMP 1694" /LENGTH=265 /DNA_ID=CAMNT_0020664039 /DNA_START=193 /DNA_END=990 /DNA_ORIENTATION=+
MSATQLAKCIASPQRVSSVLDWKRGACSIMSLDIKKNGVGMAITGTAHGENIIYPLQPISIKRDSSQSKVASKKKHYMEFKKNLAKKLEQTCRDNEVGAFIVNWPMKIDSRFGKECGQVLHTLDHLVGCPNSVIHVNRPFTLWDNTEVHNSLLPDKWGRSELFSRPPSVSRKKYVFKAFSDDESQVDSSGAAHTLRDFLDYRYQSGNGEKYHYVDNPEETEKDDTVNSEYHFRSKTYDSFRSKSFDSFLTGDYESNSTYVEARLL